MNPLLKKEIRSLLPGWLAVLLLSTLMPWIFNDADAAFGVIPLAFFLGMVILAVDVFGREFSLGTFSSLMSQPIERRTLWRTKVTLLLVAAGLIFIAYATSCGLRVQNMLAAKDSVGSVYPDIIQSDFHQAMFSSIALLLVAVTGALWTSLLLRQTAAAFWITGLAPAVIVLLVALLLPKKLADDNNVNLLLYSLAAIYSVWGFWLARRMFFQAQDVAWMGGIINFSRWRYFEGRAQAVESRRKNRPLRALFKKEFQLHSISLICAAALLAVHLGVLVLRGFYGHSHEDSLVTLLTNGFWVFWLVMPLIIGCTAVAEERKLGMADAQLCLPASRRRQFAVKFFPALLIGTLLGGVLPLFLEIIAGHFGSPSVFLNPDVHPEKGLLDGYILFLIYVVGLAAGLVWLGFLASSLTKNFLQALSLSIAGLVLLFVAVSYVSTAIKLSTPLPGLITLLTIPVAFTWLAWRNFSRYVEDWRLWRRNILGLLGAGAFIALSSLIIYNRAWEVLEPAEPSHGPARWSLSDAPKLRGDFRWELQVQFPDGRVWCDSLGFPGFMQGQLSRWAYAYYAIFQPLPTSAGPEQFIDVSNWVSTTTQHIQLPRGDGMINGYLDTVGVKRDGTLWISSEAKPKVWTGAQMTRIGDETDWKQVVGDYTMKLLLKTDGTLWQWGTNRYNWNGWQTNWPTMRNFRPEQIGTNNDWQEIFSGWGTCAQKLDGTVWHVTFQDGTNDTQFIRLTNLDEIVPQTFSSSFGDSGSARSAYVGLDGTLWIGNISLTGEVEPSHANRQPAFLRVGAESNWVAVIAGWDRMIALKTDGSLWRWKLNTKDTAEAIKVAPARFGIHSDWVGITSVWDGMVSLAADGSLWFWPDESYHSVLMKAPKQPERLANVFDTAN